MNGMSLGFAGEVIRIEDDPDDQNRIWVNYGPLHLEDGSDRIVVIKYGHSTNQHADGTPVSQLHDLVDSSTTIACLGDHEEVEIQVKNRTCPRTTRCNLCGGCR